ncbi:MAG: ribosome-associated translation inhibitor RaiA [Candidatus Campbellbacteria bacterium]|nr:ribosome-associated translation inhibitor RaiA [Candidatus Campbellbacteria bacterium]
MKTRIKATNMELTDPIRDYLNEKLKDVEKFIPKNESEPNVDIEIGKTTNHHSSGEDLYFAEINVNVKGDLYRYVSENAELYAAIDKMKDEIIRELRRNKEKKRDLFRRGALKFKNMIRGIRGGK